VSTGLVVAGLPAAEPWSTSPSCWGKRAQLSDVVKASVYVTDRAHLAPVAEVVLGSLSGVAPAFGALIVKGLASPELLIEVDITAVIAEART
jgi:enamine deaminase RidA (YjgF/YER057c/UK114 family)